MSKDNATISPDVNRLIVDRLNSYPLEVKQLALKAIQLSETLPEETVFETLQGHLREATRRQGGNT
jgi:hypothetical protein